MVAVITGAKGLANEVKAETRWVKAARDGVAAGSTLAPFRAVGEGGAELDCALKQVLTISRTSEKPSR